MDFSYNMDARRGAWADEDIDDFEPSFDHPLKGFESKPDKDGIKHVISYIKDSKGATVKITKKVREIRNIRKINMNIVRRRQIMEEKLGKNYNSDMEMPKLGDEISIELSKNADFDSLNERESDADYYFMDLPTFNSNKASNFKKLMNSGFASNEDPIEKITYGQIGLGREGSLISSTGPNAGNNSTVGVLTSSSNVQGTSSGVGLNTNENEKARYQPPFLRGGSSSSYDRNVSLQSSHRDDCTVRVANLSEDATEDDLQELFKTAGRVVKVFLAKNKNNTKNTKGFAFITYSKREEAQNAIRKLNRHGYDNLLLNVEWARTKDK
ncbi:RNA recognition family protein [Cryptosporidium andersoni]|uniref:Eukaryotic translation initiation factor 3 subunit G n=1 Tax=Cryptosporidium andersoni TaxID=117008 RepID=A0A1J4MHQ1_9CRYT|nr:RNA recognition family protein [Cryptosporidium andersoni]